MSHGINMRGGRSGNNDTEPVPQETAVLKRVGSIFKRSGNCIHAYVVLRVYHIRTTCTGNVQLIAIHLQIT